MFGDKRNQTQFVVHVMLFQYVLVRSAASLDQLLDCWTAGLHHLLQLEHQDTLCLHEDHEVWQQTLV